MIPTYSSKRKAAFTLVELLVSMAVLSILMLLVSSVVGEVQRAWRQTSAKVSQFREARRAFDVLKNNISQATLNTYLRYRFNNSGNQFSPFDSSGEEIKGGAGAPTEYVRYSELQFISGPVGEVISGTDAANATGHAIFFQAPLGVSSIYSNLPTALNGRGYYVLFGSDSAYRPPFVSARIPAKQRFRLMEYAPPTEENTIYDVATRSETSDWFRNYPTWSRPIADNVLTLVISPKRPVEPGSSDNPRDIAARYFYDSAAALQTGDVQPPSAHELPPEIEILMVVVDEASAQRLAEQHGASKPFEISGFTNATESQFRADLDALEKQLTDLKVDFRIFASTITMRNSKWRS